MKLPFLLYAILCLHTAPAATLTRLEERDFGKLDDGSVVKQFTMRNANGMTVRIITYGAIISELQAPDRNGAMTNVVLGADSLLLALAAPDCRAHSPNENFPLVNFFAGMKLNQAIIEEIGRLK